MKILIVGDVFSKMGRESFERNVKKLKEEQKINFIIVNGENHYKWYMQQGVNVITLGNHSYSNKSILNYIDDVNNLVRPYNFPDDSPGKGYCQINYNGIKITVMQLIGKVFMNNPNDSSPFHKAQEILDNVKSDIYICDIHAETTSEKVAFGHHFDWKIKIIYGTHTHVKTSDARILDKGSAYITDVGMTGPLDGVIGVEKNIIIDRYLNESMMRFTPQETGKSQFNGILVEINEISKKATKIDTISIVE